MGGRGSRAGACGEGDDGGAVECGCGAGQTNHGARFVSLLLKSWSEVPSFLNFVARHGYTRRGAGSHGPVLERRIKKCQRFIF